MQQQMLLQHMAMTPMAQTAPAHHTPSIVTHTLPPSLPKRSPTTTGFSFPTENGPVQLTPEQLDRKRKTLSDTTPCPHNSWDNVRIKAGISTLRCRECQKQWRVHHSGFIRCREFTEGGCSVENCPDLHIFRYKETLVERKRRFGNAVLSGAPCSSPACTATALPSEEERSEDSVSHSAADNSTVLSTPPMSPTASESSYADDISLYSRSAKGQVKAPLPVTEAQLICLSEMLDCFRGAMYPVIQE